MATLKSKHKTFIVTRLACFENPTDIQKEFGSRYGFEPSLSQISYYNPQNAKSSSDLSQRWKDLFKEARERFTEDVSSVPIANKRYRLEVMQEGVEEFVRIKNYLGVAQLLEQAAKEVGGAYTNKKEVDLKGLMQSVDLDRMTDQQLERLAGGEHPLAVLAAGMEEST